MSSIINKIKEKTTHKGGSSNDDGTTNNPQEQQFKIQPYPESNGPEDLQPDRRARDQRNQNLDDDKFKAFNTPGPVRLSDEQMQNLPPPKSREELQARQAQLNAE